MSMTTVATRPQSRVEVFVSKVLPPQDRDAIRNVLPRHVPFERFERNLSNALMNEPRLLDCNPREVFREVAKIASLGLLIDSQLGEAYLIASAKGPQARIGYRGLIKLARQSGDVSGLYSHEVCQNDEIVCELGTDKKLIHKPDIFGDRGPVIGYYAVIKYKDGDTDFEPMNPTQINAIRDRSDGYKAFKAGKIKDTPWNSGYDEMAKKTTIRRLAKRSPQSPDLAAALKIEDEAEHIDYQPAAALRPPRPAQIEVSAETVGQDNVRDPEPDVPDYAAMITALDNEFGACEAVESLDEANEQAGWLNDAPADVQRQAADLYAAEKARIDRQNEPKQPRPPRPGVAA